MDRSGAAAQLFNAAAVLLVEWLVLLWMFVLVTEATHMPRAERCFRKQGLAVVPAACCFTFLPRRPSTLLPNWGGLARNEATLHEGFGLLWYWLSGRI